jgi:hypothetical protein
MWTRFMDMHSGGKQKEPFAYCYIEAPQKKAELIFYNLFKHNPHRITCTCCGEDYSISTEKTLSQISADDRNCAWDKESQKYIEKPRSDGYGGLYRKVSELDLDSRIRIIRCKDITPDLLIGYMPKQGYTWV